MSNDLLSSAAQSAPAQEARVMTTSDSHARRARLTEKITGIFPSVEFRKFLAFLYSLNG